MRWCSASATGCWSCWSSLPRSALSVWLLLNSPKGFFPQEDIGQLSVSTEAREDISFDAMTKLQAEVADVFTRSPYVAHVASSVGGGGGGGSNALNAGRLFVELKPKTERPQLETVLSDLRRQLAEVPGINTYMVPVQNLNIGARASKSQYQIVVQALDTDTTDVWAQKLADAMSAVHGTFVDVTTDLSNNALQATLVVDRDKAATLGIDAETLRSTLYSASAPSRSRPSSGRPTATRSSWSSIRRSNGRPSACCRSGYEPPAAAWCRWAPSRASIAPPAR